MFLINTRVLLIHKAPLKYFNRYVLNSIMLLNALIKITLIYRMKHQYNLSDNSTNNKIINH